MNTCEKTFINNLLFTSTKATMIKKTRLNCKKREFLKHNLIAFDGKDD